MHRMQRHALAATLFLALVSAASATVEAATWAIRPANTNYNWLNQEGSTPKAAYIKFLNLFVGGSNDGNTVVTSYCQPKRSSHLIKNVDTGKVFYGYDVRFVGHVTTGCR